MHKLHEFSLIDVTCVRIFKVVISFKAFDELIQDRLLGSNASEHVGVTSYVEISSDFLQWNLSKLILVNSSESLHG